MKPQEITVEALVPVLNMELAKCEHGEVSLTLTMHQKRIVKWSIARTHRDAPAKVGSVINDPTVNDNV